MAQEINMSEPISSDIAVMQRRESMWLTRFLSGFLSSFDCDRPQILGAKEFPSLSKVFSHLRQATLPFAAPSPTDRYALTASVGPSHLPGPYRTLGFGHGRPSRPTIIILVTVLDLVVEVVI